MTSNSPVSFPTAIAKLSRPSDTLAPTNDEKPNAVSSAITLGKFAVISVVCCERVGFFLMKTQLLRTPGGECYKKTKNKKK